MSKKLDEESICEHVPYVTDENAAWVLLQEPNFIGFGVIRRDDTNILWPPNKPRNSLNWSSVSDLRLFGEKGEWHVWRDWDGKHQGRLLEFGKKGEWSAWLGLEGKQQACPKKNGEEINTLTEYHFLWGTKQEESGYPSWIKLTEERGAEIWLPLAETNLKGSDLPLRLKLKQIVGYDSDSHLAGIVDAALIGLVRSSDEELLLPTDLSPCS